MHKGKLSIVAVTLLLGAAAPSFGQSPKEPPIVPPPQVSVSPEVNLHTCKSASPEHQDEQFRLSAISKKWRMVTYQLGNKPNQATKSKGCRQLILNLTPNDTFTADTTTIKFVEGAAPCNDFFLNQPGGTAGIQGKIQTFCYVKSGKIDRYAMMLTWENPSNTGNPTGAIYSLQGADQNSRWAPKFVGMGVDSDNQEDVNIILIPEPK